MSDPRITVYVPSRNYGRFLGDAIESVLRQTVSDWELIVIDDGSTDETSKVTQLYQGHPKISVHRTESIGLPAVCNFALARARGRYIIRLDGDDVFDENILLVLANMLDRDENLALVFPDYYLVDLYGEVFAQERRQQIFASNHVVDLPPNGACTLVRAAVLREVGGYREDLGAQDGFDLWSKVTSRYKCSNVNLPLFYYRRHGKNLTSNDTRIMGARRQIKRDAVRDRMVEHRPIIAVIPCRRNFDFISNLWNARLGSKTLLEHDIEACLGSAMLDFVVITCDNEEAKAALSSYDDPRLRFVLRDEQSTIRTMSIVGTLERIAREYDSSLNGLTLVRYVQSPFITYDTIEEALTTLVMTGADSASGVEEVTGQIFRRRSHGLEAITPAGPMRSDFDAIYRDAHSCIALRNKHLPSGSLMGRAAASFVVSSAESLFIDSEQKLGLAKVMAGGGL